MFTISCHDARRTVEDCHRATGVFLVSRVATSFNCSRRKLCGKKRPDSSMYRKPHHELLHGEESPTPLQVAFVNISHISRILEMPASNLHRKEGSIDLLIRINYPRFHIGETKGKDGLVARRSPWGESSLGPIQTTLCLSQTK